MLRPDHLFLMIGADLVCRHCRRAIGSEEHRCETARPVEQRNVLRLCYRNSAQRRDCLVDPSGGFEHIAQHQNNRKSKTSRRAPAERTACDQPGLVHTVKATAPGPLGLGNHLAPGPAGRLKSISHYVEVEVVVADQCRTAVSQPNGLAASTDCGRWSILAQNLVGAIVIADQGTYPIIMWHQLRHVEAQSRSAFVGGRWV